MPIPERTSRACSAASVTATAASRPWHSSGHPVDETNAALRPAIGGRGHQTKRTDLSIHTAADRRAVENAPREPTAQDTRLAYAGRGLQSVTAS